MIIYKAENFSEVDFYEKLNGDGKAYCNLGNYDISTLLINISFFYKDNHGGNKYFINMRGTNSRCLAIGYSENWKPIGIYRDSLYDAYSHLWDDRYSVSYYSENNIVTNSLSPLSLSLNGTQYNSGSNNISSESIPVETHGDVHYIVLNNNYLYPCKLKGTLPASYTWDNQPHYADECGMWDSVNNIFYGNANSKGVFTVSGNKIGTISAKKKIFYLAYATSNNQLVFPKKLYWANSSNSVQLVYIRPVKELHIINPSFFRNFENYVTDITEIRLTSHIPNATEVVDNNIVNITHNNRFVKTYMWLTEDTNNVGKYIGYIGSPWYDDENSKFYCHEVMTQCFMKLKVTSLQHIVDRLDTSNVTAMNYAFSSCTNFVSLDLSNWKTSNVSGTGFFAMFSDCISLQSLNVLSFDTSKSTSLSWTFNNCKSLRILDLSTWNTSNITSFWVTFSDCSSLHMLDLSTWNTSKAENFKGIFNYCTSLEAIYVNFNTEHVTDFLIMFRNCPKLTKIVSPTFDLTAMQNDTDMFNFCTSIIGGNGTTYDYNYVDSTYARVDGENGLPGYFTDPATQAKITLMNSKNDGLKYLDYITINSTYTIPTLQGYTAVVTDNNGNTYSDGDSITITENLTLTFVWSAVNNN